MFRSTKSPRSRPHFRRGAVTALALSIAAPVAIAIGAPAYAINSTSCGGRTDLLDIYNGTEHCYANAGGRSETIRGVTAIRPGDNDVLVYSTTGNRVLPRSHSWAYDNYGTVTSFTIL